jgi:tetratricopeptide (TPR) repeat protein
MQSNRLEKLLDFLENEPNDPFLLYAIATEYLGIKDSNSALKYFEILLLEHQNYVGTYYHLGKLYEALDRNEEAIKTYQAGMLIAHTLRDNHALSELQSVYNSAIGLNEDD